MKKRFGETPRRTWRIRTSLRLMRAASRRDRDRGRAGRPGGMRPCVTLLLSRSARRLLDPILNIRDTGWGTIELLV